MALIKLGLGQYYCDFTALDFSLNFAGLTKLVCKCLMLKDWFSQKKIKHGVFSIDEKQVHMDSFCIAANDYCPHGPRLCSVLQPCPYIPARRAKSLIQKTIKIRMFCFHHHLQYFIEINNQ